MAALKEAGIADNTIVVFTSDNGPTAKKYAKPFRGTKYVTFEGGHRVPFIFHWPAKIKQPSVSDVSVNAMDLFPTLSAAMNSPLPTDRIYDGENLLPLIEGGALTRSTEQPFYYYNCENLQAIRRDQWKLHLPRRQKQLPFWDKNRAFSNLRKPVLYDLHADEGETTNVASSHTDVVKELMQLAEEARADLGEFLQRGKSQRPTGSLFPDVPVISHEKDWGTVDLQSAKAISAERQKRHPNQSKLQQVKPKRSRTNPKK